MAKVEIQRHALGITWVENEGMSRSAHALAAEGRVWLIDPFDDAPALEAAAALGEPAGVIQLLDRHNRDCAALAQRLGAPLLRLPESVPDSPFEAVRVVSLPVWREVALWWPQNRALIIAEAIGTVPPFALGRRAGVHPLLRLTPPRSQLGGFAPDALLVGHGRAIESGAGPALQEALAHSRTDMPRLVTSLPAILRAARGG